MKTWILAVGLACMGLLCGGCRSAAPTPPAATPSAAPSPAPTDTATPQPTLTPTGTAVATSAPTAAPPSPTPTRTPSPAPSATQEVQVYEQPMTILTYPFAAHLVAAPDSVYGGQVVRLDRGAYEASRPEPSPHAYRALVVENAYLRLIFLPELGGRLYQCVYKPTNQAVFYNNRVLKPTYWGPLPREENWWLAAGGLEWAFPVNEHGYEWGAPWEVAVRRDAAGVEVVLRRAEGALQAEVIVAVAAGEGRFTVSPRLTNAGSRTLPVQFWANAMLSPGSATVGPDLRLIFPAAQAIVHSTGDPSLPGEGATMPWPVVGGRDLRLYANWRNWLGVFAAEPLPAFVGAYDARADVGVARVLGGVKGVKLFGFGSEFPDLSTFTDDGSAYVELWAGANRTFWPGDDVALNPGASVGWTETWIPVAGMGGFTAATPDAVVRLEREGGGIAVGAFSPVSRAATLQVEAAGATLLSERVLLGPGRPVARRLPSAEGPVHLRLRADDGILLAEAQCP